MNEKLTTLAPLGRGVLLKAVLAFWGSYLTGADVLPLVTLSGSPSGMPLTLPDCALEAGLKLHVDARTIGGLADGGALTEGWHDARGTENVFLPSVAPTFVADAGGSYPAVRFNGVDQSMEAEVSIGASATIFVVFTNGRLPTSPQELDPLLAAGGAQGGLQLTVRHRTPGQPELASLTAAAGSEASVNAWVNGWRTSDLSGDFWPGRPTLGVVVYEGGIPFESLRIGSAGGGPGGRNDIREILVFDRALEAAELKAMEDWLAGKHGLAVFPKAGNGPVERYNMVLGSQQFGGADAGVYTFGESGVRVLDYARETLRQGASMIKFRLSNRFAREDGFSPNAGIDSLVKLVRDHPEVKAVIDLPVTDILCWVSSFSVPKWQDRIDANGLRPSAQQSIYNEVYELVVYLLQTYSGSGKSFYLGNWEGDWMLTGSNTYTPENLPPQRIQAMIDWANIRQKAIDDAKAATPHDGVNVWFYVEMNKADWARDGRACVLNSVIPAMPKIDFISISSYTMHKQGNGRPAPTWRVHGDLNLIQAQLDAKPNPLIPGSRLIVGEYGYNDGPNYNNNLVALAQDHLKTAWDILSWQGGTVRFILQWQFFNEATSDTGASKEMRQINEQLERLPLYEMHKNFYREMRRWVNYVYEMTGQLPGERAFADRAVSVIESLSLTEFEGTPLFTNFSAWRDFNFPEAADRAADSLAGPMADPLQSGWPNLLRYAMGMHLFSRSGLNRPQLYYAEGGVRYRIPFDPAKSDLRWFTESSSDMREWARTLVDPGSLPAGTAEGPVSLPPASSSTPEEAAFYRLSLERIP